MMIYYEEKGDLLPYRQRSLLKGFIRQHLPAVLGEMPEECTPRRLYEMFKEKVKQGLGIDLKAGTFYHLIARIESERGADLPRIHRTNQSMIYEHHIGK